MVKILAGDLAGDKVLFHKNDGLMYRPPRPTPHLITALLRPVASSKT